MKPGEASQLILDLIEDQASGYDDLGRRVMANKIIGVLSGWLPQPKKDAAALLLEPMDDTESKRTGRECLEFGKYAGQPIDEVPDDYLAWLADSSRATWIKLSRYLRSQRVQNERTTG